MKSLQSAITISSDAVDITNLRLHRSWNPDTKQFEVNSIAFQVTEGDLDAEGNYTEHRTQIFHVEGTELPPAAHTAIDDILDRLLAWYANQRGVVFTT